MTSPYSGQYGARPTGYKGNATRETTWPAPKRVSLFPISSARPPAVHIWYWTRVCPKDQARVAPLGGLGESGFVAKDQVGWAWMVLTSSPLYPPSIDYFSFIFASTRQGQAWRQLGHLAQFGHTHVLLHFQLGGATRQPRNPRAPAVARSLSLSFTQR